MRMDNCTHGYTYHCVFPVIVRKCDKLDTESAAKEEGRTKMFRTRMFSFAFGFSVTGAAIAHFVWRDLWSSHGAVSLQTREYYDALERRIARLESEALQGSLPVGLVGVCSDWRARLQLAWNPGGQLEIP